MNKLAITAAAALTAVCAYGAWVYEGPRGLPADAPAAEGEAETSAPADVAPPEPTPEPSKHTVWLYAGLGLGSNDVGGNASLNYKYLRYSAALFKTFDSKASWGGGENAGDWGVLVGWSPVAFCSLSAGVAWVDGSRTSGDLFYGTSEKYETLGVPVEVQLSLRICRIFGFGAVGHFNFNREDTFGSLTLGIQLGKLK